MIEGLEDILVAGLPDDPVAIYAGDTGPTGATPSVWVTGAGLLTASRAIAGRAGTVYRFARLVCSAETHLSATRLAHDVAMVLDGARHPEGLLRVTSASEAIEDRDDPTGYVWSSSVDVTLTVSRPR